MPLDIVNRFNVTDNATLNLSGARSTTSAEVGGTTYLFVAGYGDNGVSVFAVGTDGTLTNTANVADQGALRLAGASSVATAEVGGTTYLFAAGLLDGGFSVFEVGADGSLANIGNLSDYNGVNLSGIDALTTAVVGGTSYLFVGSFYESGVSVFAIDAAGGLTNVANVNDNATLAIGGLSALKPAQVGGVTYLFATGYDGSGLSVFAVGNDGSLTNVDNVSTPELAFANGLAIAQVGGTTYLFVANEGTSSSGLTVFSVGSGGALHEIEHLTQSGIALTPTTAVIDGITYLFVPFGDGVSAYQVADDGLLTSVGRLQDDATLQLAGASSVTTATVAGKTFLFVTGVGDNGVSTFELSTPPPASGPIVGTDVGDTLSGNASDNLIVGLGGNDTIDGRAGQDTLVGGEGDDTLTGGAGDDDIHGDAGIDTAVFSGNRTDYLLQSFGGGRFGVVDLRTGAPDGADILHNVEILRFADGDFSLHALFNQAPIDIAISHDTIAENSAPGTIVGTLSATDPDSGEAFTYQLLDNANGRFTLNGSDLVVAGNLDFEIAASHQVTVRVTDSNGAVYDETLTIGVNDVPETGSSTRSSAFHIENRDNVSDDATLELDGTTSAATAVVGGVTYLFVTGAADNGLSVFAVNADGTLANVANVTDDATLNLGAPFSVATALAGGTTYLIATGFLDNGLSVFRVDAGGALVNVSNVSDDGAVALSSAFSVTTAEVGGNTYVFATGLGDNGVSVFRLGADGSLANVDNVFDNATLAINGPVDVATAEVVGVTYLFVAGATDGGISAFAVGNDGSLINVANVFDDVVRDAGGNVLAAGSLKLDQVNSVATATVNGVTYLFASSAQDEGVSVFRVDAGGTLVNVDNVGDTPARHLAGAAPLTVAVVDGVSYLFVGSVVDSGVSVFAIADNGTLTNVANVAEDATLNLLGTQGLAAAVAGGIPFLFAVGGSDNGVSTFALSSDDTLIGTSGPDTLEGGTGNDLIVGHEGTDTAVYSGNQADYRVTDLGQGRFEVADLRAGSPEGTDTLEGVERLRFAEGTVNLTGAPNQAPTAIALSHSMIAENSAVGALVAALSATDPDSGDTFTYQLLDDAGGRFTIHGNLLEVAGNLDFETATSHQITVRVTDAGGLSHDQTFTIGVTDVAETAPGGGGHSASAVFRLENRDNVSDDATLNLQGANSTATAVVDGVTYLFVTGASDEGISVFAVNADGTLANVANVSDDATLNLHFPFSVATAQSGGVTYLIAAGALDNGLSVFRVDAGGSLVNVANVSDDATLALSLPLSVATAVVGGATYVFAAGVLEGVSVFSLGADGSLANVDNVFDNATLAINGPVDVATAEVGGVTYLFVAGQTDDGIGVFAVGADGSLTNTDNVFDDGVLKLDSIFSIATATVNGITYLFATGNADDGVSVFRVDAGGTLVNVDNVGDTPVRLLDGAASLTVAVVDGVSHLFAGGQGADSGVSVFAIADDGSLVNVANLADDATLNLLNASSFTTAVVAGAPFLFATSGGDNGVSTFALSSDDTLVGTSGPDTLEGGTGDDLIVGRGDTDTAVYSGNQADYRVTDLGQGRFEVADLRAGGPDGTDTLEGVEMLQFADGTVDLTVPPNQAPTDIALSSNAIAEDSAVGTLVATLSATDPNTGDTFTYQLLDDAGGRFTINGNLLEVAGSLDFETAMSHQITVRVTDAGGLSHDQTFTIGVTNVDEAPTAIALSNNAIAENSAVGTVVATLSATDPDTGDTFTYQLLDDAGGRFTINGNLVEVAGSLDFETAMSHQISVRVTDAGGLSHDQTFTIGVTNVNESPTAIALSGNTIAENSAAGTPVATLSATDPDAGDTFTYRLLDDAGGRFAIHGNLLEVAGSLDFETAMSHQITVRVTDAGGLSHDQAFTIGVTDVADNTPAHITGTSTGDVIEAGGLDNRTTGVPIATGNLDSTDTDNPNDVWQAVAPGAASAHGYGSYAVTAAGVWAYTLNDNNAAVQALNCDRTLTDTFDVLTQDGTRQTVTITIHGQDDAPPYGVPEFDFDGEPGTCSLTGNSGPALAFHAVTSSFQSDLFDFRAPTPITGVRGVDAGPDNGVVSELRFFSATAVNDSEVHQADPTAFGFNGFAEGPDRAAQADRNAVVDLGGGDPQHDQTGVSMFQTHSGDFLL